jgi:hypothetical protein
MICDMYLISLLYNKNIKPMTIFCSFELCNNKDMVMNLIDEKNKIELIYSWQPKVS